MKKILYIIAAGAILLASCSKENSSPNVDDTAVKFSTEITTRASGTAWDNGDAIGVFMLTAGDNISTSEGLNASNVNYTYTAGSFSTATSIYYPQAGNVDFVAYYPWRTTPASTPYIYKVDVGVQTTPADIDILYATKGDVAKSKTAVALTFDHKLSRVVLNITKGAGMTTTDLSAMGVQLMGMPTKADFALATGTFNTPIDIANITPRTVAAGTTYDAILIPQTGTTGRKMVFTVGTDVYEYAIPASDDFLSGKSYAYIVAVKKTGVSVSRGDITDWTGTGDTPGDLGEASQLPIPIPIALIPAGSFIMGSPGDEPKRDYDETQHEVTLTNDFYMSKCQITSAQYAIFLNAKGVGENRKSVVTGFGEQVLFDLNQWWNVRWENSQWVDIRYNSVPMIKVNWYGAKAYADWLSTETGLTCRLPTEAQWEYACRAGTTTAYSFGDDVAQLDGYAWYMGNSNNQPHAVGEKLPNPWGLYDMHGSVFEWCSDWYNEKYGSTNASDAVIDPTGSTEGPYRVFRGGSWNYTAQSCRSAYRGYNSPGSGDDNVGFRVVFVP